jgi:hypothetical protein
MDGQTCITDFLKTTRPKPELAMALAVLRSYSSRRGPNWNSCRSTSNI